LLPQFVRMSRLDLDNFVRTVLDSSGKELGLERRWPLSGGFLSEKTDGFLMLSYSRCS